MNRHSNAPSFDRRRFLTVAGSGVVATMAGCLGLRGGNDNVVLDEPDAYDRTVEADVDWPIYGEQIPTATVPAPLLDRSVTTTEFTGERHTLFTFIFTRCPGACPGLMAVLRHVQADSVENDYADEVAFMPITFDPEHDTPSVLEDYEQRHGVERSLEHWFTLRPETPERAQEVVEETFGCMFERTEDAESDSEGETMDMAFMHTSLVLLANKDGYVERAYTGDVPAPSTIVDDARTIVEGW
ncbi:SCO family protein [Halobacteria archaeon AArc-curdl1]|uniref:SCO family protein n=1 Tax=Natronosalvus hydrolyticus TaxID=2979988 RepID=A0AAP2ZAZ1_9EURY|nr:SCO family protein [Halobacteria archaeon AArc-curdl1]